MLAAQGVELICVDPCRHEIRVDDDLLMPDVDATMLKADALPWWPSRSSSSSGSGPSRSRPSTIRGHYQPPPRGESSWSLCCGGAEVSTPHVHATPEELSEDSNSFILLSMIFGVRCARLVY